jgi:tetratricopeptide (TPR) repeat protein
MRFLAVALQQEGRWHEAAVLHEKVVSLGRNKLGKKELVYAKNGLAHCYWRMGNYDRSVPLFEEIVDGAKIEFGESHVDTLVAMSSLGINYCDAGQVNQAVSLLEKTLKSCQAELPPGHGVTTLTMNNLAIAYNASRRHEDALPLLEKAFELYRHKFGNEHPETLLAMNNLASTYSKAGRQEQALELHKETLKLRREKLGPDHFQTLESSQNLGRLYVSEGKFAEAEPLLIEAYRGFAQRQTANATTYGTRKIAEVVHDLVKFYENSEQPEKAVTWQEKLDAMETERARERGSDDVND